MRKLKKPFLFSLAIFPIAVIAAAFTCFYQLEMYPAQVLEKAIAQIGSKELLILASIIQTAVYTFACSFFGYILAQKAGFWKPLKLEKNKILQTVFWSVILGGLFSLDYWTFGSVIPGVKEATAAGMTLSGVAASVLYGGIIEEIMLRLFFMSLLAVLIWKLFFRGAGKERVPGGAAVAANIISACFFAAGHLPATISIFGEITPLILFRCFLFNGGFGVFFGWLYRRHGIWYAMLGHSLLHIVSKMIWLVFA